MEKSAVRAGDGGRPATESRDRGGMVPDSGGEGDALFADRIVDTAMFISRAGGRDGPAFGPSSTSSGSGVE